MSQYSPESAPSPASFGAVSVEAMTSQPTPKPTNTSDGFGIAKLAADPYAASQWYLQPNDAETGAVQVGIIITSVWSDYTGEGISIGVIDEGFDYSHQDIAPNYDVDRDIDRKDSAGAQNAMLSPLNEMYPYAGPFAGPYLRLTGQRVLSAENWSTAHRAKMRT